MSVILGAFTLMAPVGSQRSVVAPSLSWTMADGRLRTHVITTRFTWQYEWVARGAQLADVRSALNAAMLAEVTFRPWDEVVNYTVKVLPESVNEEPEGQTSDGAYRVTATIAEVTA